jgi:hypothetical protein
VPIRDPAHIAWSGRPAVFRLAANAYAKLAEADRKTKDRVLWDRAERKETWSITMEAAITLFVAVELVFSILNFLSHKGSFVQQA